MLPINTLLEVMTQGNFAARKTTFLHAAWPSRELVVTLR